MPADPSSAVPSAWRPLRDASPLQEAEPSHLLAHLAVLPDPRACAGRPPLVAILALAAAAVLAGARSFAAIAE